MGGKTLHSQARTLALKVLNFFEDEKSNKKFRIPVEQALKRACAATGISKATLLRIKNEAKKVPPIPQEQSDDDTVVSEPCTSVAKPEPKLNLVDSFYAVRKEIPTLKKILTAAKANLNFPGEKTTLHRILVNYLGYRFKKCKNARQVLIQKPEIVAWRARYLRKKKRTKNLGRTKDP
ncbi:unnamed protein product [Euphydryas editha]|uniref:Uncharacterized protein n=1 Tax=Euphydryas editha TaxID=104508 RepID=A0AAU9TYJ9_EUPED|nr:unnamed protein product [Euphydryas editha]